MSRSPRSRGCRSIVAPGVRVAPVSGFALHTLRLHGALSTEQPIHDRQFDFAVRVPVVAATYRLGRDLDVGLGVTVDVLLDRPHYEAATCKY